MEQFYLFGLTALLACCLKALILSISITRTQLMSVFNIVCLMLISQNAFEFLAAFTFAESPELARFFVDGVLISLYLFAASLVYFSLTIIQFRYIAAAAGAFTAMAAILVLMHIGGYIVAGYKAANYTIISEEAAFYPLFRGYVFAVVLVSIGSLIAGSRSQDEAVRSRSRTALLAIAPICAVGVGVQVLKVMGFNASTAIVMPLASTFFVWILMLNEAGEFITFKLKWRIIWRLATNINTLKLADWSREVEKQLVLEALHNKNYNQSAAARLLSSNQVTFHRKARKHLERPVRRYNTQNKREDGTAEHSR